MPQDIHKTYSNPPINDNLTRSKTKQKNKSVVLEYGTFPVNKVIGAKAKYVGKVASGNSIKRVCQCCFVVKKPSSYLDPSMCILVYESTMHFNSCTKQCHGSMVSGFQYTLGVGILKT